MLYEIVYRTGGTLNAKWHRVSGRFTADGCNAKCAEIERMGYKTLTYDAGVLDVVGLPVGWDYKAGEIAFTA